MACTSPWTTSALNSSYQIRKAYHQDTFYLSPLGESLGVV